MKSVVVRLTKYCSLCARRMNVIVSPAKRSYRGGHYFGTIPAGRGKEIEYWECPSCYWEPNTSKSRRINKRLRQKK